MRQKTVYRQFAKADSNNPHNPNKNICALRVAHVFSCENETRYLHNIHDLTHAIRSKFSVRSVKSLVGGAGVTVSQARKKVLNNKQDYIVGYVIRVKGHVLALDAKGKVIADTDPRQRDRRQITHIYGCLLYTSPSPRD